MATSTPIVHASFAATLARLKAALPQGIVLHGEKGVGLHYIARYLTSHAAITLQPITKKGEVDAESGTISIEEIRNLYEQTRSGGVAYVIIDDADRMSVAAQNAFLKLLEEPSSTLHFILTSHHLDRLLPTIRSRVQAYHVPNVSDTQSQKLLENTRLSTEQRTQALFLAAGRPAHLLGLASHPQTLAAEAVVMSDARTFLSAQSRYDRLVIALRYATSRAAALQLVGATLQIIRHSLYHSPTQQRAVTAQRLLAIFDAVERNANPKLQLLRFVLE